jgi:uncharacterized membrane protein
MRACWRCIDQRRTVVTSLPLHPALVHLPLGLAFIIPVLALAFAWAVWLSRVRPRAWVVIVALQAVLFGAGFAAMTTGEGEEKRVERVVPAAALKRHEAYAEQFLWGTGLTLGLASLVLIFPGQSARRVLVSGTVAATLVVAALAIRVGHAGGQLVYVHNAGAAYVAGAARSESDAPAPATTRLQSDDDRRGRRTARDKRN